MYDGKPCACQPGTNPMPDHKISRSLAILTICSLGLNSLLAHDQDDAELEKQSKQVLLQSFHDEKSWIKVHAAEALMESGLVKTGSQALAEEKIEDWGQETKIGFFRVQARNAESAAQRAYWISQIEEYLFSSDRPQTLAIESLAKLGYKANGKYLEAIRQASQSNNPSSVFALWAMAQAGDQTALSKIIEHLDSPNPDLRRVAAYSLRWLHPHTPQVAQKLIEVLDKESPESVAYAYLVSAAIVNHADPDDLQSLLSRARKILQTSSGPPYFEICHGLLGYANLADLASLAPGLNHADADTRIGAALVILDQIKRSACVK